MKITQSPEQFLKSYYQDDELNSDKIRSDIDHWNMVSGDAKRFPNANLDAIEKFLNAAYNYLAG